VGQPPGGTFTLKTLIQSDDSDEEYVLRRILGKFVTPEFPTVEEGGVTLLDQECVDDLISKRVSELAKAFFTMNGVDEEAIELAEEQHKEALKGNLERNGGARVNPEKAYKAE